MNPVAVFETLHAESTPFRLVFWAAIVATAAGLLQWLVQGGGQPAATISPLPPASSTYASPYAFPPSTPAPVTTVTPAQRVEPLKPRSRPIVEAVKPPSANSSASTGLAPRARPELEGIVIEPPRRGLTPKPRPELGTAP